MGKRHNPGGVISNLREVKIALAQGETTGEAIRRIAVAEQAYGYRHAQAWLRF